MDLSFEHVTKFYGPVIGVNDVSCVVGPGITGLLGANGAGKSTLINLASGQLVPTQGRVLIGKHSARSVRGRRELGYSPDLDRFYEEMTGREFVTTMARLHGFGRREAWRLTEVALERVDMAARGERRLAGCSHGMRQRIKLAQALVHDPAVLLLDEPLSGIDPGGRHEINDLLRSLAEQGKTILVSTHILSEIEALADTVLMIARGRVVASGTLRDIRRLMDDQPLTVELVAAQAGRRLASLLVEMPAVQSVEVHQQTLLVRTRQPADFFASVGQLVLEHEIVIERMQPLDAGADAVFNYVERSV